MSEWKEIGIMVMSIAHARTTLNYSNNKCGVIASSDLKSKEFIYLLPHWRRRHKCSSFPSGYVLNLKKDDAYYNCTLIDNRCWVIQLEALFTNEWLLAIHGPTQKTQADIRALPWISRGTSLAASLGYTYSPILSWIFWARRLRFKIF